MSVTHPPVDLSVNRRGARLIARFMRTHPMPTVVSVVGAVAFSAAAVGATVVVGNATDRFVGTDFGTRPDRSALVWSVVAVVAVGVAKGLSVVVRRYFAAMLEARMQATLRRGVVDKYLSVPLSFHHERPTGELLAHADADVSGTTMLIKPLPFSIGLIALVLFALASLVLVDWTFTLVALGMFPLLTLLNRFYTRRVEQPSARVQQRLGDISSVAHESFDGALAVKTLGLEARELERFSDAADRLRRERLVVGRLRATFEPVLDLLPNLGVLALFLLGAWRIDAGAVSSGDLVQATLLFSILAFPMRVFGFFLEELPRAVVSVERVDRVLAQSDAPGPASPAASLPDGPLGVVVDDVWFAYDDAPVLRGVTFEVHPGETVAVVGSTGSGKSTLTELLVRLLEPASGQVRVGGVDVAAVDPAELRHAVALVFQESFLFAATVRENVALGALDEAGAGGTTDGTGGSEVPPVVQRAAEVARVARFVPRLPNGWETVLGERGVTLSGGQRQRVALARALARRPRVLILDDATSAVDPTIEAEILDGLRGQDATLLVVAHRLSTITLADRVVYLEEGRVGGVGTHDELLSLPGYAALVHAYEDDEEVVDDGLDDLDELDEEVAS